MNNDIQRIELSISNFYKIISGKKDYQRDWASFQQLFITDAKFNFIIKSMDGGFSLRSYNISQYIDVLSDSLSKKDFYEFSISNDISIYGNLSNVINKYDAFSDEEKKLHLRSGVNIVNLVFLDMEWKINSMLWQSNI